GQYFDEEFFGLFWGEQQPFVSSGCGGLYFFAFLRQELCSRPRPRLRLTGATECWSNGALKSRCSFSLVPARCTLYLSGGMNRSCFSWPLAFVLVALIGAGLI